MITLWKLLKNKLLYPMILAAVHLREVMDLEPFVLFFVITNSIECIALVTAVILLVLQHRATQRHLKALQILVTRGIQPEQLIKLASTLDRLSESDVEDLLASRVRPPETGSSGGSSV